MGVCVDRKFGRIVAGAAVAATAGTALITGTAFAGSTYNSDSGGSSHRSSHHSHCNNECHDSDHSDCDSCNGGGDTDVKGDYYKNYRGARAHEGGTGGRGGVTNSKCLAPVGLSAGAVASSGGQVDQCNSNGGNGGEGGAGDVGINH
jgi:hypothetical protein